MQKKKMTVMVLPAGASCNLACRYCYHGKLQKESHRHIMPLETFQKIVEDSRSLSYAIDFLWHGGEPLLTGIPWYQTAMDIQKRVDFKGPVRNVIQTNGTLINREWTQFFAENHFLIGISMDGPQNLHDANRCHRRGRGTFREVMQGIENLRAAKRAFGVITVVTRGNVKYPEEVYSAIRVSGARSCAFHFYSSEGTADAEKFAPTSKDLLRFFKEVLRLWFAEDNPSFMIRDFQNIIRVVCGGTPLDCASNNNHCRRFVAVMPDGEVYPCHRFIGKQEFRLGNVHDTDLTTIYRRARHIYDRLAELPQKCMSCRWLKMCGGGCAHERYTASGTFASTHPQCQVRKELFKYLTSRVPRV